MSDQEQLEQIIGRMSLDSVLGTLVEEANRRLEEVKKYVSDGNVGAAILYTTAADLMADEMWVDGVPLVQRLWSDYGP